LVASSDPVVTGAVLATADIVTLPREAFEAACRGAASPSYLGGGLALCRIMARYKLYVATSDDGFGANVLLDGYWESWLTRFMARRITPGATVVDVGANFGYYSLLLADLAGAKGRLYAVEPNPDVAALLRRSIALNGFGPRTTICEAAAGDRDGGSAILFVPKHEPKNAAVMSEDAVAARAGTRHTVPCRTLDSIVGGLRVDFIKIDAEGAEQDIIAGMEQIFAAGPPNMVLEFNAARYADPRGFLERLIGIYGSLRHIDFDAEAVPVSPERVLTEQFGEDWLLFLSRS